MAESITYKTRLTPYESSVSETAKSGEYVNEVILDTTNFNALAKFINNIKAGSDVSSVVTAINALPV